MAKQYKQKEHLNMKMVSTKSWLRKIIMQSIQFWAPTLNLDSFVDQISFYIAENDDPKMDEESGAEILVDSTTRTATIKVKRNVVSKFASEYSGEYAAADIVEMTIIHELSHILVHPISKWVHATLETLRNNKTLENLFCEQEEITVEHFVRLFFAMKKYIKPGKFNGKIIYLTEDPDRVR